MNPSTTPEQLWLLVVTTGGESRYCFHPEVRGTMSRRERIGSQVLGNMLETRAYEDSALLPFVDWFGEIESYDYDTADGRGNDYATTTLVAASSAVEAPRWVSDVRDAAPLIDQTTWDLVTALACSESLVHPWMHALQRDLRESQRRRRAAALKVLDDESSSSEAIRAASDPSEDTSTTGLWAAVTGVLAALHPSCPPDVLMRCAVSSDMYTRAAVSLAPNLNDEVSAALAVSGGAVEYQEHFEGLPDEGSEADTLLIQGEGANVAVIKVEGDNLGVVLDEVPNLNELIEGNQLAHLSANLPWSEFPWCFDDFEIGPQAFISVDDAQTL